MKVQVIGDGGAFNIGKTNSAFLIKTGKAVILYDCGYNVFTKLRTMGADVIGSITHIVISHMDDDHMGSLKTLLYYRYFELGKTTKVIGNEDVRKYLQNINYERKASQQVPARIMDFFDPANINTLIRGFGVNMVRFVKGVHHVPAYGMIIANKNGVVAISGDTKANYAFEVELREVQQTMELSCSSTLLFHDFSYWDAPSRQVHACKSDFEVEYSKEFKKNVILYHNDTADIEGNSYALLGGKWEGPKETTWKR